MTGAIYVIMDESKRQNNYMISILCTTNLQELRFRLHKVLDDYRNSNGEVKYHGIPKDKRQIVFSKLAKIFEEENLNCFVTGLHIDTNPPSDPYSAFAATTIGYILDWVSHKGMSKLVPPIYFIIDPTPSLDPDKFKEKARIYAGDIRVNDPPPNPTRDCELWAADIMAGVLIDIFVNNHQNMKGCFNKLRNNRHARDPIKNPIVWS